MSGTSTVGPAENTTYTLTARNARGEVSATAVVGVIQTVKILNFLADPAVTKQAGDAVTLRWTTSNATEVVITGVGSVPVNGSTTVRPLADATYTLIAYGKRSQASAFVIVRAGPPPPPNRSPVANAGPPQEIINNLITTLDGSRSFDPDGDPITFSWRPVGFPRAEIYDPTMAKPTVRMSGGFGRYEFELTVSDNKGNSSTARTTVQLAEKHP